MQSTKARLLRSTRGASFTEYGIMLALVGAVAIATTLALGLSVEETFTQADDGLNAGIAAGMPGSGGGQGTGQNPGTTDTNGCYVESGGDSVNSFDAASPITCFDIANGADSLVTARPGPITITAANGPKTFTLNGAGQHTLDITDVPSGSLAVGQATVTATNSALNVDASGRFELDATGPATTAWVVETGGEDDVLTVRDGARFASAALGAGNDSFTYASPAGAADSPTVAPGAGSNDLTLQCADGSVDWSNTTPIGITAVGNDSITTNGCPISVDGPAEDPATGAPVDQADLTISHGASSAYSYLNKVSPYGALTVQGTVSGSNLMFIDTLQSRQLGPITIDLAYDDAHLVPGPNGPRVNTQVTLNADNASALAGPDVPSNQPASIAIDASAAHAAGADTYTAVVLNRPTAQQNVALTGGTAGTRNIHIDFPDPTVLANTGVPTIASDGPVRLEIILEGCGDITLHAKAGSGRSDVVISDADCQAMNFQPVNNVAFAAELPFYEGLTIDRGPGSVLEMGFNGGALPNGATLPLENIIFGISTREDVSGGGGN